MMNVIKSFNDIFINKYITEYLQVYKKIYFKVNHYPNPGDGEWYTFNYQSNDDTIITLKSATPLQSKVILKDGDQIGTVIICVCLNYLDIGFISHAREIACSIVIDFHNKWDVYSYDFELSRTDKYTIDKIESNLITLRK